MSGNGEGGAPAGGGERWSGGVDGGLGEGAFYLRCARGGRRQRKRKGE